MFKRPEPNEADPYYFRYIDQAVGENAIELLIAQLEELLALLSQVSEPESLHRYAPGKWSLRELLNHVTDTERAFAFRALWFARGFEAPLPGYDQDIAAAGADADRVSWQEHREEFRHVRLASVSLFRNLPDEAWSRQGLASGCRFTVRAVGFLIVGHAAHHARILQEKYLVHLRGNKGEG